MRLTGKNAQNLQTPADALETELMENIMADHHSYHEMEDVPVVAMDVLSQFKANVKVLSDLTSRLAFMNREIRYVMKVD